MFLTGLVHLPRPAQFLALTDNLKGTVEIEQLQSLCPGYVQSNSLSILASVRKGWISN